MRAAAEEVRPLVWTSGRTSRPSSAQAAPNSAIAPQRRRAAVALGVFALTFATLAVGSYTQKSATWDEPIHLVAGYAMLTRGDYRLDPEHPPLLRMWAALPLLFSPNVRLDTSFVDVTPPSTYARVVTPVAQKFLYVDNDGDPLLYRARFMTVLLGLAQGALVFAWAWEWLGLAPAVVTLIVTTLTPCILANASLVTTDAGLALFVFAAVYAAWRMHRRPSWRNQAAVVLAVVLAMLSKFSALVLFPVLGVLLAWAAFRSPALPKRTAAMLFVATILASWLGIWSGYGWRYAPSVVPGWTYDLHADPVVRAHVPRLASAVEWIDGHRLLPNVYSEGFLFSQSKAQERPAFLAGQYRNGGWWYYFPFAFLIKTPIGVLAALAIGLVATVRGSRTLDLTTVGFVLAPPAIFLAAAMTSSLNIGIRHILPVYPFVSLIGAVGVKALWDAGPRRAGVVVAGLTIGAAVEFARAYPDTLAFFNAFAGGPDGGERYLVDSNLDWGQDLKPLKAWMDSHGVSFINLAYFGTADPAYYGIRRVDLPASHFFIGDGTRPRLPGYVAISATILNGVELDDRDRHLYAPFRTARPVVTIGHSIHVYWVDRPWW